MTRKYTNNTREDGDDGTQGFNEDQFGLSNVPESQALYFTGDESTIEKKNMAQFFLEHLDELSYVEREIILMTADGKSEREIASVLGIPAGSIQHHKNTARTTLLSFMNLLGEKPDSAI